jgi:hypothetical protein
MSGLAVGIAGSIQAYYSNRSADGIHTAIPRPDQTAPLIETAMGPIQPSIREYGWPHTFQPSASLTTVSVSSTS